jgi:hypothetical protein
VFSPDDISRRFTHHVPPNEQVRAAHDAVRQAYKDFALSLSALPACRETALVFTALEESSFWAHAAVAREAGAALAFKAAQEHEHGE